MIYLERAKEIAAVLTDGLEDAGRVHHYQRWAVSWGKTLELFRPAVKKDPQPINAWEITRRAGKPNAPEWEELWVLHKYRSLSDADASEITFQSELDEAVRLFRDTDPLSFGAVPEGISIEVAEARSFGDVFCHYAECHLRVVLHYDQL